MLSDIEIAQSSTTRNIREIAAKLKINDDLLECYGRDKAKLPLSIIDEEKIKKNNLILVTAITPTPAGEGKTTTSIALTEGLNRIGKQALAVLREPSLGPVFGIKGGAAGGGYSQVLPMEDINLHFTGDFSAIEKANNLLSALIDNNIQAKSGNLGIDPRTVVWKRVMDMNDRALRQITIGMGGKSGGIMRQDGFNITAASEVMAILCMSTGLSDLKERLGNIYIGDTYDEKAIHARDLKAEGPMTVLLKEAIKPNLVQTIEGNPAILHGGPFANIAQGTNTIIATKMGLSLSDYAITEAGFGADLGAEKFLNIKCRAAGLSPKAVVLVATVRALKYHGGLELNNLQDENIPALKAGLSNLEKHIENILKFNIKPVVCINRFSSDTEADMQAIKELCDKLGVSCAVCDGWAKGGAGSEDLAHAVVKTVEENASNFAPIYDLDQSIEEKVTTIAREIYGANGVNFSNKAKTQLKKISQLGLDKLPVCIAKTQKSFSDNEKLRGRPSNFDITVREIEFAAGAGFIIPITGYMLRMPGLPAIPAAVNMDIDADGVISGLS